MKKCISLILAFVFVIGICASAPITITANAASVADCVSFDYSNVGENNYFWNWSDPIYSYLDICSNGDLMRFQVFEDYENLTMFVEYYDSNFNLKSRKTIKNELPLFGGFYSDGNNYYILSGQNNPDEDNSVEVFRLTKYDLNWNRISACSITDDNTTVAFRAGTPRFTHSGNQLLIRTDHEMYTNPNDGLNHQANVTLQINTSNMTLVSKRTRVLNSGYGYSSHSFNQFIKLDGNKIVAADHGDAYPRTLALFIYDKELSSSGLGDYPTTQCLSFLDIPGQIGANYTGCTIGGFEVSDSNYIIAGTKINLNDFENSETKNVFISYIPKNSTTATVKMITSYAEGTSSASTPHFVKISHNKFMLLWERDDKTHYLLIDEYGNKLSEEITVDFRLSDCPPVIYNNKIVWYTYDCGQMYFYQIDLSDVLKANSTYLDFSHNFNLTNVNESIGTATVKCLKCGCIVEDELPPEFVVDWYNNDDPWATNMNKGVLYNINFSYFVKIEDNVSYWCGQWYEVIFASKNIAEIRINSDEDTVFENYIIKISDANLAEFMVNNNGSLYINPIKDGEFVLTAYLKFLPSERCTRTILIGCEPGHEVTMRNKKSATCTENGYSGDVYCYNCEKIVTKGSIIKAINPTGHNYSNTFTVDEEPTEHLIGSKSMHCTRCDAKKCVTSIPVTKEVLKRYDKEVLKRRLIEERELAWRENNLTKNWVYIYDIGGTFTKDYYSEFSSFVESDPAFTGINLNGMGNIGIGEISKTDFSYLVVNVSSIEEYNVKIKELEATHNSGDWVVTRKATVEEWGEKVRKCKDCGMTIEVRAIPQLAELSTPKVTIKNSAKGIGVSWNTIENAEKYIVYSKTYNAETKSWSGWKNRGTVTGTSWSDTTVKSGTKYKYTVKAVNGSVKSEYKSSSSILYLAQPTVKITNASTGVKVSWNKITGATGYKVYRAEYTNGKWSGWKSVKTIDKGSTVSWTDKSAKSGVKYKYTVKAVNGKTASTYKSSSSLLYLAQPKVAVRALSNGIKVAWVQSTGATSYKIYRSEYNTKTKKWSSWEGIKTAKSTSKSYTDKSAKKGVKYRYTVKAVNGKVASTYKASGSVKR